MLSFDGTSVAFMSNYGGRYGIWVQSLSGGPPTWLAYTDAPFDWRPVTKSFRPRQYLTYCGS